MTLFLHRKGSSTSSTKAEHTKVTKKRNIFSGTEQTQRFATKFANHPWNPKQPVLMDVWWFPTNMFVKIWFIIQLKQPIKNGCLEFQVYIRTWKAKEYQPLEPTVFVLPPGTIFVGAQQSTSSSLSPWSWSNNDMQAKLRHLIPGTLKLSQQFSTWKWMVGRWLVSFWGSATWQVRNVSFRECRWKETTLPKDQSYKVSSKPCRPPLVLHSLYLQDLFVVQLDH